MMVEAILQALTVITGFVLGAYIGVRIWLWLRSH